jgi:hypothetical protein
LKERSRPCCFVVLLFCVVLLFWLLSLFVVVCYCLMLFSVMMMMARVICALGRGAEGGAGAFRGRQKSEFAEGARREGGGSARGAFPPPPLFFAQAPGSRDARHKQRPAHPGNPCGTCRSRACRRRPARCARRRRPVLSQKAGFLAKRFFFRGEGSGEAMSNGGGGGCPAKHKAASARARGETRERSARAL